MQVASTPSFNKDVSKIKDGKISARLVQMINKMRLARDISELTGLKKLSGAAGCYRIRIADYRLGFILSDNTIQLVIFAHRKEIYRYFP